MPANNRKPPAKMLEEARKCYELQVAGFSTYQIAEKMGFSQKTVRNRIDLHITKRVHPKVDEIRERQIARLEIYIRGMWAKASSGDEKAVMAAVRTEERIAKLMGSDSATAFKVEVEQTNDKLEVLKMMEQMFGAPHTSHGPAIPGEVVPTTTEPRKRRPLQTDSVATTNTNKPNTPPNEFPDAIPAHEVQEEAVTIAEDIEPTPQPQPRRKRKTPDTTSHLLRDYDD